MTPLRSLIAKFLHSKTRYWVLAGLALVVLLQVYYVQEMIAALFIFSILFLVVCAALLVIFVIDRASQRTVNWAESGAIHAAHAARRGVAAAEEFTRKHAPAPAEEPRH